VVDPEPNQDLTDANDLPRQYSKGTTVTLTAVKTGTRDFEAWYLYDPNYSWDIERSVTDTNNAIVILMDRDHQIEARFEDGCGASAGTTLPPLLIGLGIMGAVTRRVRRSRPTVSERSWFRR